MSQLGNRCSSAFQDFAPPLPIRCCLFQFRSHLFQRACHRRGDSVSASRGFATSRRLSCSRVAVTSPLSSVHSRLSWSRIPRGHCRKHSTNEGLGRVDTTDCSGLERMC